MRYLIFTLFFSVMFPQDVLFYLIHNEDTGMLDVYMENDVDVFGFEFTITWEQGEYCENGSYENQFACESEGYNWYYMSGMYGPEVNQLTIGTAGGGLAEEAGFMVSGNPSGTIMGFSLTGTSIPPGEGVLTSVLWNGPELDIYGEITLESGTLVGPPLCYYCEYVGCMDPIALNYNPDAIYDDGSCENGIMGDVNQDDEVNVLDVVEIVLFAILVSYPSEYEQWAADVNEDGAIDILDIVWLVNCILEDCWQILCTDIDGNIYETIQIGDQVWMAENLKVTRYGNGDEIPTNYTDTDWSNLDETETGAYTVYPWDQDVISQNTCNGDCAEVYGNLYNWFAVNDSRNIAPEGWHVPTDEEWMELEMFLGMSYDDAQNLMFRGTNEGSKLAGNADLWYDGILINDVVFNTSGFSALPGGFRSYNGNISNLGAAGTFWTSSGSTTAYKREVDYNDTRVSRINYFRRSGYSVRCVKDYTP